MCLKLLQKQSFKTAESTSDLVGNKNGDLVIRALKTSPKIIQKQMKKIFNFNIKRGLTL